MKKVILFATFLIALTACSNKQKYSVTGVVNDRSYNGKQVVFRKAADGRIVVEDTVKIMKSAFEFKGSLEEPEVRYLIMPGDLPSLVVVLEEGEIVVNVSQDSVTVGGTLLNDKLQARDRQNQRIVNQIKELDDAYVAKMDEGTLTQAEDSVYKKERYALLVKNTDDIIAFTKENIGNVLGKHFFMKYYPSFPLERREEMISFATDELKDMYGEKQ